MISWDDAKKDVTALTESEKLALELTARMVSDLIKQRKKLGLTQEDLANKVGLKQSAISRLESGKGGIPRIETLLTLAAAMNLKLRISFDEQASAIAG